VGALLSKPLNFIHHRHEAGGIGKRLPFAFTDPVCWTATSN